MKEMTKVSGIPHSKEISLSKCRIDNGRQLYAERCKNPLASINASAQGQLLAQRATELLRSPLDVAPLQGLKQFRPLPQHLLRLRIAHPLPISLVLLWPVVLLLPDAHLIEPIRRAGSMRVLLDLLVAPLLLDCAEIDLDLAFDAGFFPRFAAGCLFLCSFVGLPAAFWEHPAFACRALDQHHL